MIELTEQQALAVEGLKPPLHLLNPRTQEVYVLVRKEVYDLACAAVGGGKEEVWDDEADDDLIRKPA